MLGKAPRRKSGALGRGPIEVEPAIQALRMQMAVFFNSGRYQVPNRRHGDGRCVLFADSWSILLASLTLRRFSNDCI